MCWKFCPECGKPLEKPKKTYGSHALLIDENGDIWNAWAKEKQYLGNIRFESKKEG